MELLGGKEERIVWQLEEREDESEEVKEEIQDISHEELVRQ